MARWFIIPLFRSYFVRCPSGKFKRVFWNADRAFPLVIPGVEAKLSAGIDTDLLQNSSLGAEYKKKADALLFQLDELSGDLSLLFRGAYVLYQTDPCEHGKELALRIRQITERHQTLRTARLEIRKYVDMIRPETTPSSLAQKYAELVDLLKLTDSRAVTDAMDMSRAAVQKMTEVQ